MIHNMKHVNKGIIDYTLEQLPNGNSYLKGNLTCHELFALSRRVGKRPVRSRNGFRTPPGLRGDQIGLIYIDSEVNDASCRKSAEEVYYSVFMIDREIKQFYKDKDFGSISKLYGFNILNTDDLRRWESHKRRIGRR